MGMWDACTTPFAHSAEMRDRTLFAETVSNSGDAAERLAESSGPTVEKLGDVLVRALPNRLARP